MSRITLDHRQIDVLATRVEAEPQPKAIGKRHLFLDRLANEVATLTGESPVEAVKTSLTERLAALRQRRNDNKSLVERLNAIADHCAALPDYDTRSPEEIIGYDDYGAPR